VLDEVIEFSLKPIRPNFAECWWDTVIFDIIFANTVGIIVGMVFIDTFAKILQFPRYDWLGRDGAKSVGEWKIFTEHRRWMTFFAMMAFVCLNFVTGFTLPNSLWVPPNHWLNIVRVLTWFVVGGIGIRENYEDMLTWGKPERA
jgi:phosphatidylserine synthase 2